MLSFLSSLIFPMVILLIIVNGILNKVKVYDEFVKGAKEGIPMVLQIMPTLIGLMSGVGILQASGFFSWFGAILQPFAQALHFPKELLPLTVVRLFSGSAANGFLLNIYKEYGTDSFVGMAASIMMSSTETLFYTMSVYFLSIKVTKTRWTLLGALLATFAGIIASILIAGALTGV